MDLTPFPITGDIRVNTYTPKSQSGVAVTALLDGGFVVTWMSDGQDGSDYGVYGQRYNSAGEPVGDEFRINTYTPNNQYDAAVTALSDGSFVVTWSSRDRNGNEPWTSINAVYGQRYNSAGEPVGGEFRLNDETVGAQSTDSETVTTLADGRLAQGFWGTGEAYIRIFDVPEINTAPIRGPCR